MGKNAVDLDQLIAIVGQSYTSMRAAEGSALRRMNEAVTWQNRLSGIKLTRADLRALRAVRDLSEATMGALSESLGVTKAAAASTVDALVEHKLLSKEVSLSDNRKRVLALTGLGSDVLERTHREMARAMVGGLDEDEIDAMSNALAKAWALRVGG